ncbi:Hypothetical protein AA314_09201 [Archangium gephyra]|uniref:Uncharacterized protein n=1 Tax=Archangium gephyra TaxID=48 RepID=A0AAC8TJ62_9BACT|nr:Hypothetical protein AA314_09201 [Archangium gephyra]
MAPSRSHDKARVPTAIQQFQTLRNDAGGSSPRHGSEAGPVSPAPMSARTTLAHTLASEARPPGGLEVPSSVRRVGAQGRTTYTS